MFSSGSSFNPFDHQYFSQIASESSYIQNPSSTEQNLSSPFLYLPTSFDFDHSDLLGSEFLSIEQEDEILGSNITLEAEIQENPASSYGERRNKVKEKKSRGNAAKQQVSRKRSRKNDRHSKILTAHGPRDRRMRLSLPIARKFFDLQDMLGFDKASKTIEWLFTKSKDAIKEFADSLPKIKSNSTAPGGRRAASTSESEVGSGVKLTLDYGGNRDVVAEGESFVNVQREKKRSRSNKQGFNPFAKESREKARARARERTREKNKMKGLDNLPELSSQANPNKLDHLSSLDNGENLGSASQDKTPPQNMTQEEESSSYMLQNQMDTINLVAKCLGTTGEPRSSTFDSSYAFPVRLSGVLADEFAEICVNWEMTNPRVHHKHSIMPKTKPVTGSLHAQNPNAILLTPPFTQEQNSCLTMANTSRSQELAKNQEQNGSSAFMNISNANEQTTISALMTPTYSQFIENQFFYNAIFPHNSGSLN